MLTTGLDVGNDLLNSVADSEIGFSCRDLGHLNGELLSLDTREGSERNETQTRGCFAERYLWGLVLLRKSGKSLGLL